MLAGRGKRKIPAPRKTLLHSQNELDFDETWAILSNALHEMHTRNASMLSFEVIYRHAYKVVLKKKADVFYKRIQQFETNWLSVEVRGHLRRLLAPSLLGTNQPGSLETATANERRSQGEKFLHGLKEAWENHKVVMGMATDVFMYLDKTYCCDFRQPYVYTAAMALFRSCILRSPPVKDGPNMLDIVIRIILDQVQMDRDGDVIDKPLINGCVKMLGSLYESTQEMEEETLYLTSFENIFLESSREFYNAEGAKLLAEADAASYCCQTIKRIHEEQDRCRSTLLQSTTEKLVAVVEEELIRKRIKELIVMDSGVKHMVDNERYNDLELIFDLNSRIDPKKVELIQAIQRRVHETGGAINVAANELSQGQAQAQTTQQADKDKDPAETEIRPSINQQTVAAIQWVEQILELKDKYDHLWEVSFQSDPVIQPALTKSFSETINSFPRSSEFISLFIDENMKKGLKDKTETEVDVVLEKAIILLRYIQDRDLFERYYKKHLCKRLLMGKSVSVDVEKQMITRMKIELGNSFTTKLEAMFKDMALSEELTNGYRAHVSRMDEPKRAELSINVLTSMTWPLESMQASSMESEDKGKCIYPREIDKIKRGFENYYGSRHSGRILTWMGNMGTADVRATFPKVPGKEGRLGKERRHELNVSTYAMIVLLLFNDLPSGASLSFDEIQAKTNIGTNDLTRNLQALAVAPKTRVLVKEPMSKDVKNTDRFSFNESFQSQYLRFKVGVVAAGNKVEGEKERRETEKKNNDSRGFVIEAAVVRIMKQRKELSHSQLVAETVAVLSAQFKPDINMIKKRIESLIEREYLERVEDSSPAAYRYLA